MTTEWQPQKNAWESDDRDDEAGELEELARQSPLSASRSSGSTHDHGPGDREPWRRCPYCTERERAARWPVG